ncbi:MAG: hypothetical protein IPG58_04625 [Acidobacteria bacterium]|nr:hypothetical protein [Acidobacteriota bacterium]
MRSLFPDGRTISSGNSAVARLTAMPNLVPRIARPLRVETDVLDDGNRIARELEA